MKYLKSHNSFITENMDQAKSIMKKKMDDYEKLKGLLSKNLGYIGKFTEYLMHEHVPYEELEKFYKELIELKNRQMPVNINDLKYEKALDKIQSSKETLSINSLISKFPSDQKKFAREMLTNRGLNDHQRDTNRNILLKVSQKENLEVLLSKISRYKDINDLKNALKVFSKDPINDREKVEEVLKSINSKIVYKNDNIVIIHVDNYNDIVKLGSDTSWCIVNSEATYKSYVKPGRNQFIIYNYKLDEYDPKFKIGFTLNGDGSVHAAHDILDGGSSRDLSNVMSENGVKFNDILPKKEPLIYDINKLNIRMTTDKFKEVVSQCDLKDLPEIIKKVLISKRKDDSKRVILRICYNRIFFDRDWILLEELGKVISNTKEAKYKTSYEVYSFIKSSENLRTRVITNEVDARLSEKAFLKGMEIWDKAAYAKINMTLIRDIEDNYSKDTITMLSNKLNKFYTDDIITWKDCEKSADYKGVKLSKNYEGIMLVMNALLGRIEMTPDYKKISEMPNYTVDYYNDILKLPIDLEDSTKVYGGIFEEDTIDRVIKKDYNTKGIYITDTRELDKWTKLSEYLKDHKLLLRIEKSKLKIFVNPINKDKFNKNGQNDRLMNMFNKFNFKRLVSGTTVSDGNLSIKVY